MKTLLRLLKKIGHNILQPVNQADADTEARHYFELIIPISQLYGIEHHPSLYRYYEK